MIFRMCYNWNYAIFPCFMPFYTLLLIFYKINKTPSDATESLLSDLLIGKKKAWICKGISMRSTYKNNSV